MIENITQTTQGYRATIDGIEMFIPDAPSNRHWQMIQDAVAEGAVVTVEQAPQAPVPNLSFSQLLIGLVSESWITEDEGDAWADGNLPSAVLELIQTLPVEQQFAARTRAKRPSEIIRADPLVNLLGAAQGKTEEELTQFFRTYSGV